MTDLPDFDYDAALAERHVQEDRLKAAGILVSGGGVDMLNGRWDIFAYPGDDVYATVLQSVEQVDALLAKELHTP